MTAYVHKELAGGRWWQLSLCAQMGNVGSEVSRALKWRDRNERLSLSALGRALELLDLTLDDPRHRRSVARLREIARVREVLADLFLGSNQYGGSPETLQRYFDAFAVAASRERGRDPASTDAPIA